MSPDAGVVRLQLPASNAYLLRGARPVLLDAGTAAAGDRLRAALAKHGVRPEDLAAVVLTHGHADHAGGARALQAVGVPVLVGAADAPILAAGHNPPLRSTTASARVYRPFLDRPFAPFEPDVLLDGATALTAYGLDADIVPAPGHTPGSVVVHLDADLFIGDLARGGHLGGMLQPHHLLPHYYSPDTGHDLARLRTLVRQLRPERLHPGHGGPIPAEAALDRLDRLLGERS